MKKLLIVFMLLFSLIIAGCNNQKQLSQGELFEKNLECAKLFDTINKRLNDFNKEHSTLILELKEVFYSKTLNNCFYADTARYNDAKRVEGELLGHNRIMNINVYPGINPGDFVGNKYIYYCNIFPSDNECEISFIKKLKELKAE